MGKNYSFTVAVFLYCDSVSDCFYEEESEISDCMKQAETFEFRLVFCVWRDAASRWLLAARKIATS